MIRSWLSIFRPFVDQNGFKTEDSACSDNVKNLKNINWQIMFASSTECHLSNPWFPDSTGCHRAEENLDKFLDFRCGKSQCSPLPLFHWDKVLLGICKKSLLLFKMRVNTKLKLPLPYSKNLKPKICQIADINFILKRQCIVAFSKKNI